MTPIESALAAEHEAVERRRAAAAAEREAAGPSPSLVLAARLLGAKPTEVVSAAQEVDGILIVTADGSEYIVVPEDQPDGEGKTGVMLHVPPSTGPVRRVDGLTYWRTMPLFAPRRR